MEASGILWALSLERRQRIKGDERNCMAEWAKMAAETKHRIPKDSDLWGFRRKSFLFEEHASQNPPFSSCALWQPGLVVEWPAGCLQPAGTSIGTDPKLLALSDIGLRLKGRHDGSWRPHWPMRRPKKQPTITFAPTSVLAPSKALVTRSDALVPSI